MTIRRPICGLMVVRDEADILPVNLRHHRSAGVDHVFAIDNGSSDGTADVLEEFSREGYVTWRRDPGAYRQAELTTALAHEAHRYGAEWVLPIDADEFWHAPGGSLPEVLAASKAGALVVELINFIQRRDQRRACASGLLTATRRAPLPVGPLEAVRERVQRGEFAFVEMRYQPKHISRSSPALHIEIGDHRVTGIDGPVESTNEIVCFHLPLRSRETLDGKVEHGRRLAALGLDPVQGWHVRRWRRLHEEDSLDGEWRANSYQNGSLDVFGQAHPLVFDPSLRNLVRPWITNDARSDEPADAPGREAGELEQSVQQQLYAALRLESQLRAELAAADARIVSLQNELFQKVTEANVVIRDLQREMHGKIAEANQIIRMLQAQLASRSALVGLDRG